MKGMLVLGISLWTVTLVAQGTLHFTNKSQDSEANWPAYQGDGKTLLSGPQFIVELVVGTNPAVMMVVAQTNFLTGVNAGYFDGGVVTLSNVAPNGTVYLQARIWNAAFGSSFSSVFATALPNSAWLSSVQQGYVGQDTNSAPGLYFGWLAPVQLYPPLPRLESEVSNTNLTLSWQPTWDSGPTYLLQESPNLAPTSWVAVGVSPIWNTSKSRFECSFPKPQGTMFYRLAAE